MKQGMLLFAKTYENTRTIWYNFPVEDVFWCDEKCAIVADWVTRDPIWLPDFSGVSLSDFINNYPRPSWWALAAEKAVQAFKDNFNVKLDDRLLVCNREIQKLNDELNPGVDYLENDYFATVVAAIEIEDLKMFYSYICDCGVIVYDNNWKIKFHTDDCKKMYSDKYIDKYMESKWLKWASPQARFDIRKYFRNNIENIQNGNCVSYGCLTGEDNAKFFIRNWCVSLDVGDYIIVYSDGFSWFLHDEDFINQIIHFNEKELDSFIEIKSKSDYGKYWSEKTVVLFKI